MTDQCYAWNEEHHLLFPKVSSFLILDLGDKIYMLGELIWMSSSPNVLKVFRICSVPSSRDDGLSSLPGACRQMFVLLRFLRKIASNKNESSCSTRPHLLLSNGVLVSNRRRHEKRGSDPCFHSQRNSALVSRARF